MTDYRWVLINIMPCKGSITISGAGTSSVDGIYCPDGLENGLPVWTKIGGVRLEDSIYTPISGGDILRYSVLTSGGTFEADPHNALYGNLVQPPVTSIDPWFVLDGFGAGGDAPAPTAVYYRDKEPVLRDFGPLQYARFAEDEDLSVGLNAKRSKLTTDIVFSGEDYDFFRAIEKDPVRRCEEMIIRRQMKCGSKWETIWTGTFSTGSGSWDLDKCLFTVRPEVLDEYTCIMRALNKKVNVLQVAPVTATASVNLSIEWGGAVAYAVPSPCNHSYAVDLDGGGNPINGWALAYSHLMTPTIGGVLVYWRERMNTICVGGSPVPPPGSGWTLLADNCEDDGTATYVRAPTIPYTFGEPVPGTCVDGISLPPDNSCDWQLVVDCPTDPDCDIPPGPAGPGPWWVCYAPEPTEFPRARTLQSIANFLLEQSGCGLSEFVSDLLEWNAIGDAPGYAPGVNYVNGRPNKYGALVVLQNTDAIDPDASNPATIGEMSLKDLLNLLAVGPRMQWAVVDDVVRIEHVSFWSSPTGLDLATYGRDEKSEPLQYTHLKSEVPRLERPKWSQAQGLDFIGSDVEYTGPCAGGDTEADVKEYSVGEFLTDIAFVMTDPEAINRKGFTLLATAFDGSSYNTLVGEGLLSGNIVTNAPLSWANIEDELWRWDRFLPSGIMNRITTDFEAFLANIEQRDVVVKICCGYVGYDAANRIQTTLGHKLGGLRAFVKRAEYDERGETLTLTLRYAY